MCNHSKKNCLHLEIVGKINTYTFHIIKNAAVCQLKYLQLHVEDNHRTYESEDPFL